MQVAAHDIGPLAAVPWRSTGSVVHGGGASSEKIGTLVADAAPPISYSSP